MLLRYLAGVGTVIQRQDPATYTVLCKNRSRSDISGGLYGLLWGESFGSSGRTGTLTLGTLRCMVRLKGRLPSLTITIS
jgi:hypothetical protein